MRAIGQPGDRQGPSAGGTAVVSALRPPSRRRLMDPGGRAARQATLLVCHRVRRGIERRMIRVCNTLDGAPPWEARNVWLIPRHRFMVYDRRVSRK